ncbi:MAG: hypothetical protein ACUVS4_00495 [Chloroflexaceae bacterium]
MDLDRPGPDDSHLDHPLRDAVHCCYDPCVVAGLRRAEAGYAAHSRELTLDEWRQRPLHKRLFENLTRLMSPLR